MAGKGMSSHSSAALSPTTMDDPEGKFTFEEKPRKSVRSRRMGSTSESADASASSSAPITRENVMSPSKMKQKRKAGSKVRPPPRVKTTNQDSRDDNDSKRPSSATPSPSRSTPRTSSSRKSSGMPTSSSSSRRPTNPRSPRSVKKNKDPFKRGITKESQDDEVIPKVIVDKVNKEAQSVASTAAALLLPEVESRQSRIQKKLMSNLRDPDPSLSDLLSVLTDFEQSSHLRRVNACGAIKTLTLHKANQIPLARTKGVVPSLTSVLCAVNATEEERTRCINALMHLCVPEENWKLMYLFPQTPEALARNMADKYPQIRYAACLATSFLAKKNRREVIRNRLLMYAMARVLEVDKNGALDRMSGQDKKVFVGARLCVLKMLLHLSKNRDVSDTLARTECIIGSLVTVANSMEVAANILCIATLTNLTRHPGNAYFLVYKTGLVATMVDHIESTSTNPFDDHAECAKCALYALQNLSCTGNCRQELANTPDLLSNVTKAAFRHDCPEQQLSALHTLKNLSDDPFNLVTMTNTPGCTATLLALANNDASCSPSNPRSPTDRSSPRSSKGGDICKDESTLAMAQYLACDTLATLSHWLLTLSATRKGKDGVGGGFDMNRRTFKQCTWEAWD